MCCLARDGCDAYAVGLIRGQLVGGTTGRGGGVRKGKVGILSSRVVVKR
jgi:hypothetical protein